MWKMLIASLGSALVTASIVSVFAGAAPLPFLNPQQLQIPATGADFNNLTQSINNNVVLGGPGGNSGSPGLPSGAISTSQVQDGYPNTSVNGIQFVGGAAGWPPLIRGIGSDTSVDVGISPQGDGQLALLNQAEWIPANGITQCPGSPSMSNYGNLGSGNQPAAIGGSLVVTGYFKLKNWTGHTVLVATCG